MGQNWSEMPKYRQIRYFLKQMANNGEFFMRIQLLPIATFAYITTIPTFICLQELVDNKFTITRSKIDPNSYKNTQQENTDHNKED